MAFSVSARVSMNKPKTSLPSVKVSTMIPSIKTNKVSALKGAKLTSFHPPKLSSFSKLQSQVKALKPKTVNSMSFLGGLKPTKVSVPGSNQLSQILNARKSL